MNESNDMTRKQDEVLAYTDREAFDKWWHLTGYPNARPSETWLAACKYKDAQYSPRYEESEDSIYINGRKFYSEKVVKEWEEAASIEAKEADKERAKSQKLVEALEHYKGKSLLIQNLSGIARGQVSVFDVVTVYIEEDERWLVGDVAEKALEEYKAKEGGE